MKLRMWILEDFSDEKKFFVDDPVHVPRLGDFIDGKASGWVYHVQWNYHEGSTIHTVYVWLRKNK